MSLRLAAALVAVLLLGLTTLGSRIAAGQPPPSGPAPGCGAGFLDPSQLPAELQTAYQVAGTYPHDPTAFVEGLVWYSNGFFESTGLEGQSSLRRVDFPSGNVVQRVDLDRSLFGEGLALVDDRLVQLTWQTHIGFVYQRDSLTQLGTFDYPREGWGLTYDGNNLIASDGSANLSYMDPATYQTLRALPVTLRGCPVRNLNELEWINGEIWANVWLTDLIVRIDPSSGSVIGYLNLAGLRDASTRANPDAVLNGIAFDPDQGRIFVTGKLWPSLFQIQLTDQ